MGKRAGTATEMYIRSAPHPEETDTYTVITHSDVIDTTRKALQSHGLEIEREIYRCNADAKIAQGIYHLKYSKEDPDIGLMFCWSNSYDKSMRFRCSVGGYVHASMSHLIGSNVGSWGRKHTGDANEQSLSIIGEQLLNADIFFSELVNNKADMQATSISELDRAAFIGKLYLKHDLLTTEQLSQVKHELRNPPSLPGVKNSLWEMYHALIISLQKSHPRTWMDQQRLIHYLIMQDLVNGTAIAPAKELVVVEHAPEPTPVENVQLNLTEELYEEMPAVENFVGYAIEPGTEQPIEEIPLPDEPPADIIEDVIDMESTSFWRCLDCNDLKGNLELFYNGQICHTCYQKQEVVL